MRDGPVLADVEMVTYGTEATCLVGFHEVLHGEVLVATRSRTMEYQITDTLCRPHEVPVLHSGEERAFVTHNLPADCHWKTVMYHNKDWMNGAQLVTPSAVNAAMAA